jgi:hypothetical protein
MRSIEVKRCLRWLDRGYGIGEVEVTRGGSSASGSGNPGGDDGGGARGEVAATFTVGCLVFVMLTLEC